MKIIVTGLFVEDQDKALSFYTETLGFLKRKKFLLEISGGLRLFHLMTKRARNSYLNPTTTQLPRRIRKLFSNKGYLQRYLALLTSNQNTND